jgi:hypothetical protein
VKASSAACGNSPAAKAAMSASRFAGDAENDLNSVNDLQRIACDDGVSIIRAHPVLRYSPQSFAPHLC